MFRQQEPEAGIFLFEFADGLSPAEADHYLTAMDDLLLPGTPFVLIVASDGNSPMPQEQRKAGNLWFKEKRTEIARLCRGLVRVGPDMEPDHENGNFAKAMPFPVRVADSRDNALETARMLLKLETA